MATTTRVLGFTNGLHRLAWTGPSGTVTAYLWGGGGGAGGSDSKQGGNGTGGGYATAQFVITSGSVLDVAIGGPGSSGASRQSGAAGGAAGASYSLLLFDSRVTPASPPVQAVTNSWWGSFLNTYGIWEPGGNANSFTRSYNINFPFGTFYTFSFSTDDYGSVSVDGTTVINLPPSGNGVNYRFSYQNSVYISAGNHTVTIQCTNTQGAGGAGLTISRTEGFSGGRGGNAGPGGNSGGGGGGGGATALFLNNVPVTAAGGGAGGGGGGDYSQGENAPGPAGHSGAHNGQNGQDNTSDGGGGGGGGGGWQGGNGGRENGDDYGGSAGAFGTSKSPGADPVGVDPAGLNSPYYRVGIAQGATSTRPATAGYAAIVIETSGLNVNQGGTYFPVQNTYVNEGGVWKPVKTMYIKDGGVWKAVLGGTAPVFSTVPGTIGVSSRPYN